MSLLRTSDLFIREHFDMEIFFFQEAISHPMAVIFLIFYKIFFNVKNYFYVEKILTKKKILITLKLFKL